MASNKGKNVIRRVVAGDPLEALRRVILPQSGLGVVELVQLAGQGADAAVELALPALEVVPVQAAGLVPLLGLAPFLALEEQLLARVRPHERQVAAHHRRLVPGGTGGHTRPQGSLAVHDLVVADRQHVLLGVGVDHRERDFVVVVAAVGGIALDVLQAVVHPAHVPLQAEPQAALAGGGGHTRPGGRLLGDGQRARALAVHGGVHFLQELHRIQVLAPAELVGQPVIAGVIQVQHRGHGIHAQAVDVELLAPVQSVRHQEVAYLVAPEVEHVGAPVRLLAAARIRMLVAGLAVEAAQSPAVLGEVAGNPVHNYADAGAVQRIDQVAQVVRAAVAVVRRVVAGHLVAPGGLEGVLGDAHELYVGVAQLLHVLHQLRGQLPVVAPLAPAA